MTTWPGDLTADEQEQLFVVLRADAEKKWGAGRAGAIEPLLRRVALAIGRLDRLHFAPVDAPGFFLEGRSLSGNTGVTTGE